MKCNICGHPLKEWQGEPSAYWHPEVDCLWWGVSLTKEQWDYIFFAKLSTPQILLEKKKTEMELELVLKECEVLRKELSLMEHKVITCGVAATNKEAEKKGSHYLTKWDSPQAEEVRKLRDLKESLEIENASLKKKISKWVEKATDYYLPDMFREMKKVIDK